MTNDEQSGNASPFKGKTGLARLWRALFYSRDGLRAAYRHEDAFRQEAWLALALVPLAFVMPVGNLGRALMIASIMLVLIVELINSAIEAAIDRISLEHHDLSKRAKDIGSAAVMIALLNVIVTWSLVLLG
ncbi:MAG: diacylglycerol kinase [Rhodocyclaceae bacterium]|nr:diacylglycerol kinase [Rhodocyclaceae bacterium]MBK6552654.1 diacylglycerol kinase [Rhodocyclaceae bacterium]MBK6676169.1 diacylglycerol kinase [Rhodocyclaceae bacterium]MBK7815196.1 diacylglycerol kinase [Rhodocyclaceae bacterium]MBK9312193.1 diacylglycerol kinase [Rhodocyclaceae bacterium]